LFSSYVPSYTKVYMICKVFKIDLFDFQGFNSFYFRKSILFEYKSKPEFKKTQRKIRHFGRLIV
jgi:hypothetical protein